MLRNRIYWENGLLAETYWWHGVYDRMWSVAIVIRRTDSDVFVLYLIITIVWMFITMIVCRTYRNEATVRNDERLYDTHHIFAFPCSFYLSLSLGQSSSIFIVPHPMVQRIFNENMCHTRNVYIPIECRTHQYMCVVTCFFAQMLGLRNNIRIISEERKREHNNSTADQGIWLYWFLREPRF